MVKKLGSHTPAVPSQTQGGGHPPSPSPSVPNPAVLQQEIERLQREVHQFKELAARAQADLQNARARMGKEAEEMRVFAAELLVRQLLPTVENLRRACRHLPADLASHEWARGVLSTEQELLRQLRSIGLEPMDALGQSVDPLRHEVLLTAPGEEGNIIEVIEDGYLFRGKILRPAKVAVGNGEDQKPTS